MVKLQHAAKISCKTEQRYTVFYYLYMVKLQHAAILPCRIWKSKGIFISKDSLPASMTVCKGGSGSSISAQYQRQLPQDRHHWWVGSNLSE